MSQKDYEVIAEALRKTRPPYFGWDIEGDIKLQQWVRDSKAIEDVLAVENPRFDHVKFRKVLYA